MFLAEETTKRLDIKGIKTGLKGIFIFFKLMKRVISERKTLINGSRSILLDTEDSKKYPTIDFPIMLKELIEATSKIAEKSSTQRFVGASKCI